MFIIETSNLWPLKRKRHFTSEANLRPMLAQVKKPDKIFIIYFAFKNSSLK